MAQPIWRPDEGGALSYVPTADGRFERWMDEHNPTWQQETIDTITFWRELWAAASEQE